MDDKAMEESGKRIWARFSPIITIRDTFSDPDERLKDRIYELARMQHDPSNHYEIGGSIFEKEDDLELKVIVPKFRTEVTEAIEKFEKGDHSGVKILYSFLEKGMADVENIITQLWPEEVVELLHIMKITFCAAATEKDGEKMELKGVEPVAGKVMRLLLSTIYFIKPEEQGVNEPGYLALFHVHAGEEGPSLPDIEISRKHKLNQVIFSAPKDYKSAGIGIYRVFSGEVGMLNTV